MLSSAIHACKHAGVHGIRHSIAAAVLRQCAPVSVSFATKLTAQLHKIHAHTSCHGKRSISSLCVHRTVASEHNKSRQAQSGAYRDNCQKQSNTALRVPSTTQRRSMSWHVHTNDANRIASDHYRNMSHSPPSAPPSSAFIANQRFGSADDVDPFPRRAFMYGRSHFSIISICL
jgi:hypothetical protein